MVLQNHFHFRNHWVVRAKIIFCVPFFFKVRAHQHVSPVTGEHHRLPFAEWRRRTRPDTTPFGFKGRAHQGGTAVAAQRSPLSQVHTNTCTQHTVLALCDAEPCCLMYSTKLYTFVMDVTCCIFYSDYKGWTCLHHAASEGYTQTMDILLAAHIKLLDKADEDGVWSGFLLELESN